MYLLEGDHWSNSSRSAALSSLFSLDPECAEPTTGTGLLDLLVPVLCASGSESTQQVPGEASLVGLRAVCGGDAPVAQRLQKKTSSRTSFAADLQAPMVSSIVPSPDPTRKRGWICLYRFFCKCHGQCPAKWVAPEPCSEKVDFRPPQEGERAATAGWRRIVAATVVATTVVATAVVAATIVAATIVAATIVAATIVAASGGTATSWQHQQGSLYVWPARGLKSGMVGTGGAVPQCVRAWWVDASEP